MPAATHPASEDTSTLPPYVLALKERIAYLPEQNVARVLRADI